MNPLFARELRARWRDRRAWLLLLALTIALAFLADSMFINGVSRVERAVPVRLANGNTVYRTQRLTPSARAARSGRELFMALAIGNVCGWLLIAPILTATPIARERERGLLESLQLSHMTPLSHIAARCGAALVFLLLLQLAVAPIYAIIFWLGGVSPGEFALAGAVISGTALGGIALGTWISARSHRPSLALFTALGTVVLWTVVLLPAAAAFFGSSGIWASLGTAIIWTHPLPLIFAVTDTTGQVANYLPVPFGWESERFVLAVCAGWVLVSLGLSVLATRLVKKPLPPASWDSRASRAVESWRSRIDARDAAQASVAQTSAANASAAQISASHQKSRRVENALVADLPIDKILRFANPLLEREVRARFRLRRGGWALMLGRFALFALGVLVWGGAIYRLTDNVDRSNVSSDLLYVLWVLGALTVGALSSSSFARERESGTWEGLKLSLLSPLEIVRAKWLSPLWGFSLYTLPLWLVVPFGVAYADKNGLDWVAMLLSVGIVLLSLGTISMIGLLVSWRTRQPNTALGWVLGIGIFLFIAVPILRSATNFDDKVSRAIYGVNAPYLRGYQHIDEAEKMAVRIQQWSSFWHPANALGYVQEYRNFGDSTMVRPPESYVALQVQLAVFVLIVGGGGWSLKRSIERDREQSAGG